MHVFTFYIANIPKLMIQLSFSYLLSNYATSVVYGWLTLTPVLMCFPIPHTHSA